MLHQGHIICKAKEAGWLTTIPIRYALKLLNMIFLATFNKENIQNILDLKCGHFSISVYGALHFKETNIA